MHVVLLKTELDEETKTCNMIPKLAEIDENGFLMTQFCTLLGCAMYKSKRVVIEGRPFDVFYDSRSPRNHKVPTYCMPSGELICGNVIFAHCKEDEVSGVDENDAFFLAIHFMQNAEKLNEAMANARKFFEKDLPHGKENDA